MIHLSIEQAGKIPCPSLLLEIVISDADYCLDNPFIPFVALN